MIRKDVARRLGERFFICFTMVAFCNVMLDPAALKRAAILVATYTLKVLQ